MPTNETILQLNQAGIETVRGTNVAATRKVYARIAPSYARPITEFVDTTGTFQGRRRMGYGRQKVGFSATDIVTYEDLPWWLKFMQRGGVTSFSDAGTPPAYSYPFLPSLATDDLNSMTLEFGEPGNPYESGQVMVNDWTLRFDSDNDSEPGWMLEAGMIGRDWATTTFTPALVDRTTEVVTARGTKVFVDTTTIGTTQKTGWLISGSISGNNNLNYKAFVEDEASYAANKVGRGNQITDAELTVEFDSDVDFAQFRATTPVQRKIRLQREGSIIHTAVKKKVEIDLYGYWSAISFGEREGNMTVTFGFAGYYDATLGGTMRTTVVNALASLP